MRKNILILFIFVQIVCRAEYDSTYVLSVAQKYAIPEDVSNGDHVGTWLKTWTWQSVGTISFSMEQNFNSAFSINSSSGLITIADASKINGKVVQQDTLINLIIRTTDSREGYELDTARIWVKENAYCKFIDPTYSNTESGTRTQPYNDINDPIFTPGYGYFIKRGTVLRGPTTQMKSKESSEEHPMIIASYGSGNNATFDFDRPGNALNGCFEFGGDNQTIGDRVTYLKLYDLTIRDYQEWAVKLRRFCIGFGLYNTKVKNCDRNKGTTSSVILMDQTYADSLVDYKLEVINLEIDSTGTNAFKLGATFSRIYNVRVGFVNGLRSEGDCGGFRLLSQKGSVVKHILVEVGTYMDSHAFQHRCRNSTVEDVWIIGGTDGISFGTPDNIQMPHYTTIKNVLIRGVTRYNLISDTPSNSYIPFHDVVIEDCVFDGGSKHIYFDTAKNWIIRRCEFKNSSGTGMEILQTYGHSYFNNNQFYYNVFNSNAGNDISITYGTNWMFYNNTVDGTIDCTGASSEIVRNNFSKSLTSVATESNNIDIDGIETANYFQDYAGHNYMLKPTAIEAIDKGHNVSLNPDMAGTSVPQGAAPDIGAYEYKAGPTSNLQIQNNNQKGIKIYPNPTTGIVHIRLDNFTESMYQSEWLKVTDLFGRPVFQKHVGAFLKENQGEIDLTGLPKGFYMVGLGDRMKEKLVLQ